MEITIKRDLIGVNWSEVAELYWVGMVAGKPRPGGAEWDAFVQTTRREFEGSDAICLAMTGDQYLGGGHALSDGVRDAAIFGVVVHPDHRRRGVGRRIVQELLSDLGNVSVLLNSSGGSANLYSRLGFRRLESAMGLRYGADDERAVTKAAPGKSARYGGMTGSSEIWGPGGLELAERMADAMELPSDSLVMDLGAGSGEISCFLAREYGWRILALEHWKGLEAVKKIQQKAGGRGLGRRVTAIHGDARGLLLADESVDGVFCQGTFEMIGDGRPQAMGEIFRVLGPGGVVGIGEPAWRSEPTAGLREELSATTAGGEFLKYFRTIEWTGNLMRDAGFRVVAQELCGEGARWWSEFYAPWRDESGRAKRADQQEELAIWDRDQGRFQGIGIVVGRKPDGLR